MSDGAMLDDEMSGQISYRYPVPSDKVTIKELCKQWFPVRYADTWYDEIVQPGSRLFSLCSCIDNARWGESLIVGLIVAELRYLDQCNPEDRIELLDENEFPTQSTVVCYLLSIGVTEQYRRRGIARGLIDQLRANYVDHSFDRCRALYLHVLDSNTPAIRFYEKLGFVRRSCLSDYYLIDHVNRSAFLYALYLNEGKPPVPPRRPKPTYPVDYGAVHHQNPTSNSTSTTNSGRLTLSSLLNLLNNWLVNLFSRFKSRRRQSMDEQQ